MIERSERSMENALEPLAQTSLTPNWLSARIPNVQRSISGTLNEERGHPCKSSLRFFSDHQKGWHSDCLTRSFLHPRTEFLKSQEKAKKNFAGVRSAALRGEGCSCLEGRPRAGFGSGPSGSNDCHMGVGSKLNHDMFGPKSVLGKSHGRWSIVFLMSM